METQVLLGFLKDPLRSFRNIIGSGLGDTFSERSGHDPALLCRLKIGHHWLAERTPDGGFRRRCTRCGKYGRRRQSWSGHLEAGDRPGNPIGPTAPE